MSIAIVLLPTSRGVGCNTLISGLKNSIAKHRYRVCTFHPLFDLNISPKQLENYFTNKDEKNLQELILAKYESLKTEFDFVLITGVVLFSDLNHPYAWFNPYVNEFNQGVISALNAYTIIVTSAMNDDLSDTQKNIYSILNNVKINHLLGAIVTKLNTPKSKINFSLLDEEIGATKKISQDDILALPIFKNKELALLGTTQWNKEFVQPRVCDIAEYLSTDFYVRGDVSRRVKKISLSSRTVNNLLGELTANTLIVTSSDRVDIIMAACIAAQKGIPLAGLLLTASYYLDDKVADFCFEVAEKHHLPILKSTHKTIYEIMSLSDIDFSNTPADDSERWQWILDSIDSEINVRQILNQVTQENQINRSYKMSPPAFRYYLLRKSQLKKRKIILPESMEPRTLKAAAICANKGIAECVLIGDEVEICNFAKVKGIDLPKNVVILNPRPNDEKYINTLVELRKNKGVTASLAEELLQNPVVLATVMLYLGEVDGLVSGAEHTTADTVRPALQIIKTRAECSLVSSVFFMCMEEQVLIYGDCAINQDPNAEQLADIAIQSNDTAKMFGVVPKVAMISYSTGTSGAGVDVEKVKQATAIVKAKRPDIVIDGPLQYDAAMVESVAKQKAPNSLVAGQSTVLIFPDLNTGNTVYKAVQRSANVLSIGPLLQGLNKPVNDLSRGATVDDIVYTIALTAIQA